MSFITSYASEISGEGVATIVRRIFEFEAFETSRTQIQIGEYFLSWFIETDVDFVFIRNLVYSPRFTSLAFILEILVQIELQIGTEFGYFSFNGVIGDFEADSMNLSNLLGQYESYVICHILYDQTEFWSANRANMFRNFDADDKRFYIIDHKAKKMVKDRHQMKNEKSVSVIQKLLPAKLEPADDENDCSPDGATEPRI